MLNKYLLIGLLLLAGTTATGFYLWNEESKEHGKTQAHLQESQQALDRYVQAIQEMGETQAKFEADNKQISADFREAKRELDSYRNREHIVKAKPGLIELRINKAFAKQQKELACASGETTLCGEQ